MSSGATAQDQAWKNREQGAEAQYAREKEQAQLAAIRDQLKEEDKKVDDAKTSEVVRDFEGGYGGQEDLEDRYATTSGEH